MADFFTDFPLEERDANGQRIRLRRAGSGPPLLLLHGNPQTHAMWHRVAPALARDFTVIAPDLRGYGFSSKPPVSTDHAPCRYPMTASARCWRVTVRQRRVGGASQIDRGARVAHRRRVRGAWQSLE